MPLSKADITTLREEVHKIASSGRFSLEELLRSSADVIVFGSRAAGLERVDSDLDILVVGAPKLRKRIGSMDLICIPEQEAESLSWQHSEIFRHIAAYGTSLAHDNVAIRSVIDEHAASRKRHRLDSLVNKLSGSWESLDDRYRLKYFIKLRREFQRYKLLSDGQPVPPTAVLDAEVESFHATELILEQLFDVWGKNDEKDAVRRMFLRDAYRLRNLLDRSDLLSIGK
jgi:hypothetical protein